MLTHAQMKDRALDAYRDKVAEMTRAPDHLRDAMQHTAIGMLIALFKCELIDRGEFDELALDAGYCA
ncbi:hypothetical protein N0754_19255 [Pseudomonas aeruginosa]|nr:hypothetical protein [Pseudomonas aeruginosa]MCS9764374.1 hypothetical protein [Pseudomonas aeruginosa]MCS9822414.1 hypothetical protein [Pseudomonas aeruginosa]MCT0241131.1 hypothetical protein [Pseudomonas aeruginosa]MCT0529979.1 hypothetical protein [Pseudomonas aeruginosa]